MALLLPALTGCLADEPFPHGAIVAFGDSYTEGTGASRDTAYPAVLSRALAVPVLNAGVNGETAYEALPRLQRDVLRHEPAIVIIEFGVNEAFRGYPVQRALDGLEEILVAVTDAGIRPVLVGVHFWDYQENFDSGLRALGQEYGAPVVLDVLNGILSDEDLRSDRYHPNAEGYAIMAERIRPTVEGLWSLQSQASLAA